MSSTDLIQFALNENHVKFRSKLNEMLYSKLSEAIKKKTKKAVCEIFNTAEINESLSLADYVSSVISETEERLGTKLSEEEIKETTAYIVSLLEENEEDEDEDEDEEDEDEDEDEEDEDEDEDEEDEDEDEDEGMKTEAYKKKKKGKKAKKEMDDDGEVHIDIINRGDHR